MKRYNLIFVPGTGARNEEGEVSITDFGKQRVYRAVEAFSNRGFQRKDRDNNVIGRILFTGGYDPELFDVPPLSREAGVMAQCALGVHPGLGDHIALEQESTSTEENFARSAELYPELFEEVRRGERKLGVVTQPRYMGYTAAIACEILSCTPQAIVPLVTRQPLGEIIDLSTYRTTDQQPLLTGNK